MARPLSRSVQRGLIRGSIHNKYSISAVYCGLMPSITLPPIQTQAASVDQYYIDAIVELLGLEDGQITEFNSEFRLPERPGRDIAWVAEAAGSYRPASNGKIKDLIIHYYEALQQGPGRSEGLRQVQLRMASSMDWRHSFYWAAFIQSGRWANL